jgi:hypothetical protein
MLLWIEGFDNFGTSGAPTPTGSIGRKYPTLASENKMVVVVGRLGGYALAPNYDNTCYLSPGALTTNATMVLGFAVKFPVNLYAPRFAALYDGTTRSIGVSRGNDGELIVDCAGTVLGTTVGAGITTDAWYYIELKVVCNANGSVVLQVGEQTVLSLPDVNTKAGTNDYHTTFRLMGTCTGTVGEATRYDDLYCLDGTSAINNDFLGNMRVATMLPEAAGDSTDFTPSAGDNYACVDENPSNDDTDYVEDATTDHTDLYNYTALTAISSGIVGCQVNTVCRETDATSYNLKTVCKSDDTASDDAGQAIGTTSYVNRKRIIETDPDTGVAWLQAGLNAAQFGVKVG